MTLLNLELNATHLVIREFRRTVRPKEEETPTVTLVGTIPFGARGSCLHCGADPLNGVVHKLLVLILEARLGPRTKHQLVYFVLLIRYKQNWYTRSLFAFRWRTLTTNSSIV